MNKEHNCPNAGCRKLFRWRVQLKQHKAKCSFEACEKVKKYENENGTFKCSTCLNVFSKQPYASQHSKSRSARTSKRHKAELVCQVFKKKSLYKGLLNRHIESHEKANSSFSNRLNYLYLYKHMYIAKAS